MNEKNPGRDVEAASRIFPKPDTSQLSRIDVPFDLLVKIDAASDYLETPEGRQFALTAVQMAVSDFARTMSQGLTHSREWIEKADLSIEAHASLFPWFVWPDRSVQVEAAPEPDYLSKIFSLDKSLVGQSVENLQKTVGQVKIVSRTVVQLHPGKVRAARSGDPLFEILIASFEVQSVSFEEGSLLGWIKANTKTLTLLAAILTIPAVDRGTARVFDYLVPNTTIETTLEHQPIVNYWNSFDSKVLLRQGASIFNYEEPGLSRYERTCRIAYTQLALKMYFRSPLVIDGQLGPDTLAHLKRFSFEQHVPAKIGNPFLEGKLFDVLFPRQR